jgi:hypothetical protein
MKGLLVFVLRHADGTDCTNGGITSKVSKAILVGDGIPEIFTPNEDAPALRLVRRNIDGEYLHAEPVEGKDAKRVGWMTGGNFIYTSDARFPSRQPISVHDRQETVEQYEALSR